MKVFIIAAGCLAVAAAQGDGNPHGWDRIRRCDQTDYNPPCGVCEGVGGRPFGDKNEEMLKTTCTPGPQVDPSTAKRPVFGSTFTVDEYYEILIGKKTDPFCFMAFPNNDSVGAQCYRPQQGSQVYDMKEAKALRYDVQVKTVVGNTTTTVIHQGEYMWIVNIFPWYAAGLKQCICTEPRQGGDWATNKIYPIQYNWTDNLVFVGREDLGVEYIWKTVTVDHWAFGPHHVWTLPESGQILRMWQPFNGLEVFPNGMNSGPVEASKFSEIPPKVCTKEAPLGTIRVKCTDEGYPVPKKPATVLDLQRARTKVPRDHFRGDGFEKMSMVLNDWLKKDGVATKACEEWTAQEIQRLQAQLYILRHEDFDGIYQSTSDNRRLRKSIDDLQLDWHNRTALAAAHGLEGMHRDGHCHEAVMWYVHHLEEDVKAVLRESNIAIPLLSMQRHSCEAESAGAQEVCRTYEEKVTCASCHSNVLPSRVQEVVV